MGKERIGGQGDVQHALVVMEERRAEGMAGP